MSEEEAPGDLELVRRFANTLDVHERRDDLPTPTALVAWLTAAGLLDTAPEADGADLDLGLDARTGLRALMHAGGHADPDPGVIAGLDRVADAAGLTLRFAPDAARLVATEAGVAGALGRLLAIAAAAVADGTWARLKLCAADTCAEAFYDRSRNRSGRWCSMEVCGNRAKVRTYRSRTS